VASGLGSVDANEMAIDLAAHMRSPVVIHTSVITAGSSRNPISAGHPAILNGTLKDHHTHKVQPFACSPLMAAGAGCQSGSYASGGVGNRVILVPSVLATQIPCVFGPPGSPLSAIWEPSGDQVKLQGVPLTISAQLFGMWTTPVPSA